MSPFPFSLRSIDGTDAFLLCVDRSGDRRIPASSGGTVPERLRRDRFVSNVSVSVALFGCSEVYTFDLKTRQVIADPPDPAASPLSDGLSPTFTSKRYAAVPGRWYCI